MFFVRLTLLLALAENLARGVGEWKQVCFFCCAFIPHTTNKKNALQTVLKISVHTGMVQQQKNYPSFNPADHIFSTVTFKKESLIWCLGMIGAVDAWLRIQNHHCQDSMNTSTQDFMAWFIDLRYCKCIKCWLIFFN